MDNERVADITSSSFSSKLEETELHNTETFIKLYFYENKPQYVKFQNNRSLKKQYSNVIFREGPKGSDKQINTRVGMSSLKQYTN